MPELQDTREIIKTSLKSIEGSEVVLKNGLLAGDMSFVYGDSTTNDIERTLRALSLMISEWNLTDKEGKKLAITLENIKKLEISDVTDLINQTSFGEDKKKEQILKDSK
jgi:hypothetical protein